MTRQRVMWSVTAVLGIVCAAALAWAASLVAGQHIGLASEPLSAARALAPVDREPQLQRRSERQALSANRPVQTTRKPAQGRAPGRAAALPTTTATGPVIAVAPAGPALTTPTTSPTTPPTGSGSQPGSSSPPANASGQGGAGGDGQPEDNGGGSGGSGQGGGQSGNHPDD
jgi:hypothetical protein